MQTPTMRLIRELRGAIRYSRDQKGDDRCWVDDWGIWKRLDDTVLGDETVPVDAMKRCGMFYLFRRSETPDPTPTDAILDPAHWDDDLDALDEEGLFAEITRIEAAMRRHRDIEEIERRSRTLDDDRALYAILPEKIPADFRLPPFAEFIGEAAAPHAGCPSFWRSHANCPSTCHNLHAWGPCPAK